VAENTRLQDLEAVVYERLKHEARRLIGDGRDERFTPTSLVHEAWARLIGVEPSEGWANELHLRAAVALAMRHVLVDRVREQRARKRGHGWARVTLQGLAADALDLDLYAVERALTQLGEVDGESARVVVLKFFGGMSNPEIAEALSMSLRTVERRWRGARAWLIDRLEVGRG